MPTTERPARIGFLLAQLGSAAASRFAARTRELGITPAQAGVLRILGRRPGISQRDLADTLGAVPSRVVALIDALQAAGYVTRTRSTSDRRNHELALTDAGRTALSDLRAIAEAHEKDVTKALSPEQRSQLTELLGVLADDFGLDPVVHPGYADASAH